MEIETYLTVISDLWPVSLESNELEPLILSHFLYGIIMNIVLHPFITQDKVSDKDFQEVGSKLHHTLSKKAKIQAPITQHFRRRWTKIHTTNSGSTKENIRVGHVVVIHDDSPKLKLHLAVVQELQWGNDDLVRSAFIWTVNGVTNRPISPIC